MDKPVVLVADSDPESRHALASALADRYCVHCCGDGRQALALLRQLRPDVLVLDLMLPELDGLSILKAISVEGHKPKVLAETYYVSDYILDTAYALGADYIMRLPCEIQTISMRVDDLYHRAKETISQISSLLQALGFSVKYNGYQCLLTAVELYARNPDQSLTKELYPETGKRCDPPINGKLVEKQIRYAIEAAWKHGDREAWGKYLIGNARPSNGECIARLAEVLDVWKECGKELWEVETK